MQEIRVFESAEFGEVRAVEIDGKPFFAGTDIARALGYSRPNDAVSAHCRATVKRSTPISGKMQEINYISKGGCVPVDCEQQAPRSREVRALGL